MVEWHQKQRQQLNNRHWAHFCFPAINWMVPESKFKTLTEGDVYNKGLVN
jgi:hypothetical protein